MEMKEMTYGQEESHIQVMKLISLICFVQNVKGITYMFCPVGRTIRDRRRGYPRISRSEIKKVLNKECNVCG